jgi:hypothetical protein
MSDQSGFDQAFWDIAAAPDPPTSLDDLYAVLKGFPGTPLTVETVLVDADDPAAALMGGGDEVRRFGLVAALRIQDDRGAFVLSLWPAGHDGVFHVVATVPSTDDRWRRIERRVGSAAPRVVPFHLDHDDFSAIGTALSEHGDVEVSRMTARDRTDQSSLTRGWPSRKGTIRPSPEDVIAFVDDSGASVRTMTLHIPDTLALHLRRRAGATFYSGDSALFDDLVLGRLAAAGGRRHALLAGRQRKIGEQPAAPLTIRLPGPVFVDAEATGLLIDALSRHRALSVAVMHRNPYLHVVVTDYLDGSNFDVFVTDDAAIDIHPGYRASVGALGRLTELLSERFLAEDIAEQPAPASVSLDDLVATA